MDREAGHRVDRDRGAAPPQDPRPSRARATTVLITAAAGVALVLAVVARLPPP